MSAQWEKAKEIFGDAIKVAPDERVRFLDEVCDGNETVRREVESLLSSFDDAESFMETPAVGEVAESLAAENPQLTAGQNLGHYKIIRQIGVGGMGEVYLAKDTRLGRQVALKVLPANLTADKSRLQRFKQEAQLASALNHPNILTIYEIGELNGSRFMASEFVKGETLRERMKDKSLSLSEILEIVVQIAAATGAAHESGIVHRDIKPENIMLRGDGLVKVLDFGLAKLTELSASDAEDETWMQIDTQAGMIMGTVAYMSPEQARGRDIDTRTDVWSLGVVLYEMLTGEQPFSEETTSDTIAAILMKEPKLLSSFNSEIPSELEQVVFKSLRKEREERYKSTKDLLTDLKDLQKRIEFDAELLREGEKGRRGDVESDAVSSNISPSPRLPFSPSRLPPNNLTGNLSPMVGREKEISRIKNLLSQNDVRLVTMAGVGGTGKTRLALAVAQTMLPDFSDGVFFVELAAITNPELVASTIAQPLGVKEAGGKPILEALKDYLRGRQMLLVIDNFEQVIDAAPNIAELLAAAVNLKILITSRVLLHLSAEREFAVPPLAVPNETSQISLDELSNYEAIKLFVERARNAKPNFALTNENATDVAKICARLDGLPLAIELAAARVKILSPRAILAKLEDSLKLLTGGASDLPARQQTMRGAVEWSYDLLNEDEKTLFRRLAVFAGGFTFEAAESFVLCPSSVANEEEPGSNERRTKDKGQRTIDVLDGITSLVDKNLLVSKEQADDEQRFRMLEVVREYALESLEASGEAEAMRRSHAEYFLALGEEAEPHLQDDLATKWLDRLEEEHDNLRAALRWSLEMEAGMATRLAAAIRWFWNYRSLLTEGRGWLKAALERGSLDAPSAVRFKLFHGLGALTRYQGDYETARKVYEEILAESRAANDLQQISYSQQGLGLVAFHQGDFTTARKFYEEALVISRELDDKFGIAIALNNLGDLARVAGDDAAAYPLIEEAVAIFRQLGNKQSVSANVYNLGAAAYGKGDFAAAHSHFAECLATAREFGHKPTISYSLDGFAALAAGRGEFECAAKLAGAAEHLRELVGYEIEPAERRFRDAYLAELKLKMDEAALAELYEQGRKLKLEEAVALCLEETGGEAKWKS